MIIESNHWSEITLKNRGGVLSLLNEKYYCYHVLQSVWVYVTHNPWTMWHRLALGFQCLILSSSNLYHTTLELCKAKQSTNCLKLLTDCQDIFAYGCHGLTLRPHVHVHVQLKEFASQKFCIPCPWWPISGVNPSKFSCKSQRWCRKCRKFIPVLTFQWKAM